MARIVQSLTQPTRDYDEQIQQSLVRDIDSIVQKLNTTFQQDTLTVTVTDTADAVFSLFKTKAIGANATVELLTAPLVMEESEVLKVTAATANRLHVVLSALEVRKRTVTT